MKNKLLYKIYYTSLGLILAGVLLLCIHPLQETDVFMYLSIVREWMRNHEWPMTDPFAAYLPSRSFQSIHEWGSYLYYYLAHRADGIPGLILAKSIPVFVMFSLPVILAFYLNWHSVFLPILMFLCLLSSNSYFQERGFILGNLFACIVLFVLLLPKKISDRYRKFLPFIFILWVNTHPSFPIGLAIFLFKIITEFLNSKERSTFKRDLFILLGCVGACFLNPEGFKGAYYPIDFAINQAPLYKKSLMEWLPIWDPFIQTNPAVFPFCIELFICAVIQFAGIRNRFAFLSFVLFSWMGMSSIRFIPLSSVAIAMISFRSLSEIGFAPLLSEKERHFNINIVLCISLMLAAGLIDMRTVINKKYKQNNSEFNIGFGLDNRYFPNESLEFLDRQQINGNVFNDHVMGCYLAWKWDGKRKVLFHGFMTDLDFINRYYLSILSSERNFNEIVNELNVKAFLLGKYNSPALVEFLNHNPNWFLAFEDSASYVFLPR